MLLCHLAFGLKVERNVTSLHQYLQDYWYCTFCFFCFLFYFSILFISIYASHVLTKLNYYSPLKGLQSIAKINVWLQFFTGWWFIIDAASVYPGNLPNAAHVCGVMATLSLVMVNSVTNAQVSLHYLTCLYKVSIECCERLISGMSDAPEYYYVHKTQTVSQ